MATLTPNVSDSLTITENYSESAFRNINVFDVMTLTESVTSESFRFSPDIEGTIIGNVQRVF